MFGGRSVVRSLFGLIVVGASLAAMVSAAVQAAAPPQQGAASDVSARVVLDQYCVTCHNDKLKTAGLALDKMDLGAIGEHTDVWENVVRKMRSGMMPPPGRPRPDSATSDRVRSALELHLDRVATAKPDPGRTETFHRLNRTEYRNIIRDLLALDVDVSALLPADDSSYGFDNIAGVLKINPTGMEQYLSAAWKIARLAVGSSAPTAGSDTFSVPPEFPQYDHVPGLPFGTRGGTVISYNFPQDGEYGFSVVLLCVNTRGGDENCADGSSGFPDSHELIITIDGQQVHAFSFDSAPRRDRYSGDAGAADGSHTYAEAERLEVRLPVKAGPRSVGVTFPRLPAAHTVQRMYRLPFVKPTNYRGVERAMQITAPHVSKVTISGPFQASGVGDAPSRRAIFVCQPASRADEAGCAKTILVNLARRAYRRPVTDADVRQLLEFYNQGRSRGQGFDAGIEDALRALLVSPDFWFRIERDPGNAPPNTVYQIDDVELASRLSFFLWSSIPDDELIALAARGRLRDRTVLDRQVRRMLADSRSRALTSNFAEQWLGLRRIGTLAPSDTEFPNFEESLRDAFQRETALFVDSIIRDDRSALELLTPDYTFVNARLAQHYGIANVRGSHFRRVPLGADSPHRGLLGQGSILTLTSHPTRTSPVKRGKWILENILGTPPPPPPPNVPELQEKRTEGKVLTMRERMAEHRANPYCAGCHSTLDPVGFALENFDAIGRFRTLDENYSPVDASGALPNGNTFEGLASFRAALTSQPEGFVSTLTEKLLTYALGRGVEPYDMPAIRSIVRDSARSSYRFSSLVLGVVDSVPFKMRRSAASREGLTASRP